MKGTFHQEERTICISNISFSIHGTVVDTIKEKNRQFHNHRTDMINQSNDRTTNLYKSVKTKNLNIINHLDLIDTHTIMEEDIFFSN
jgi:predicted aldo/keto reductase-like oxidoreductase